MTKVEELVVEATQRAYMTAMVEAGGKEPTLLATTTVLLQAQLAVLAQALFEDQQGIEDFWQAVVTVTGRNKESS